MKLRENRKKRNQGPLIYVRASSYFESETCGVFLMKSTPLFFLLFFLFTHFIIASIKSGSRDFRKILKIKANGEQTATTNKEDEDDEEFFDDSDSDEEKKNTKKE